MDADRSIQKDVLKELEWEPSVDAARIGVAVENGVVTLTGEVGSYGEKYRAEAAALRLRGVKAVANDLVVETAAPHKKTDAEIARSAVIALGLSVSIPADRIKVVVRDGKVTLEGEVDWDYQRKAAGRAVRDLAGVKSIVNMVSIRPRITSQDVKTKIADAFHRSATFDAERIRVTVAGSRITLNGTLASWPEKNAAERAAWSAPGVTEVRNQIVVDSFAPVAV